MTDTQHTPGPWIVCGYKNLTVNAGPEGRYSEQSTIVLMPGARHEREITSGTQLQEMQANARLIAAAPELLASLERLVTLMNIVGDEPFRNGVTDSTGSMDEGIVIASKWLHEARAAIAKVTGK